MGCKCNPAGNLSVIAKRDVDELRLRLLQTFGFGTAFSNAQSAYIHIHILFKQINEQNIKISIKQTQIQPQYSMPHGRRRMVTPLTRDQK